MFDLVTIGDSLVDIFFVLDEHTRGCTVDKSKKKICFDYAEKMSIDQSTHAVGGNAANVAVGAKKLGLKTAIATQIGDDINGQVVIDALQKAGVDLSLVQIEKNKETRYSVVLNYQSERTILSYHTQRIYKLPPLPESTWIYYTSLGKHFEKVQTKLVSHLKKHPNVRLAMNPGSYQFAHGLNTIRNIIPLVDTLIVNKEEAQKLLDLPNKTAVPTLLKALASQGPHTIIITDSTNGSYGWQEGRIVHMMPFPIEAKARTGAGDAYTSGFLSATILGKSLDEAMRWGTANAGGVVQEFGAQKGLCTKKNISSILALYPDIQPTVLKK